MWRRKHNPRRAGNCGLLLPRLVMPLVGVSPLVSFLVPFFAPSLGPSCLLASYAPLRFSSAHHLIRSPFPRRFASSSSAHPVRPPPCLVSPGSQLHSTSGTGRHERRAIIDWRADGGERRTDGGVCLLTSDGDGAWAVIDGEWRLAAGVGVAACLPRGDGLSGSIVPRSFLFSTRRLIQSARSRLRLIISSSHRRGGAFFFPFRLPPAGSSRFACFGLFPRPRPGDVRAAVWLAAAGGAAACLRSRVPCRYSAAARSLVAICSASLVPLVPVWGVVRRFSGCSDRFPVGVGVFQYMPLNRILWLLTGIFGDGVRCPFSALPRRLVLARLPCSPPFFRLRCHGNGAGIFLR